MPDWFKGRITYGLWIPTETSPSQEFRLRQSNLSAWLEADPELSSKLSFHAKGTLDGIFQSTVRTTHETVEAGARATLREGYLQFNAGGWDLRAGRQIIPWGRSDGINPTDFLTAKSQYLLWSDEESKRFGSDSLQATWVPAGGSSPLGFTMVFTPRYPRSNGLVTERLARGGGDATTAGPTTDVRLSENPRDREAVNGSESEFAGKASYYGEGFDVDVIGFVGRRHLPQYTLTSAQLGNPIVVNLESRYERMQAGGANLSFTWGSWVLRGEGAINQLLTQGNYQPLVAPVWLDTVVGAERLIREKYRLQLQWVYRKFTHFEVPAASADPVLTALRRTNALIQGMLYSSRAAGIFRLSYEPEGSDLQAEIFALSYFQPGEALIQPRITARLRESLKLTLGASFFTGPSDQALGALSEYSSFFGEIRWFF